MQHSMTHTFILNAWLLIVIYASSDAYLHPLVTCTKGENIVLEEDPFNFPPLQLSDSHVAPAQVVDEEDAEEKERQFVEQHEAAVIFSHDVFWYGRTNCCCLYGKK